MVADLFKDAMFSSINYTNQQIHSMQDLAELSFLIISYWIRFFGRSGLCSESLQPQTDRQEKNG